MKLRNILVLICTMMLVSASAYAKDSVNAAVSTVTVQGTAHMEVVPDQAIISIGVTTSASTATDAQADNARITTAVQQKLLALGISQDKLHTSQYSLYPLYNESDKNNKMPAVIGYKVNNTVIVTLDDVSMAGKVIDTALGAGANEISGVSFKKKDELQLKQTVLQSAVKEATAKAEAIASALDKHIVKVLEVNENGISMQSPENQRYLLKADAAVGTPIQPGNIQVNGSVNLVVEIQ